MIKKGINLEIFIVLLIILMSKTVFWGIAYKRLTMLILIILLGLLIIKKRSGVSKRALKTFASILFVLLLGTIVHFSELTTDYILTILQFLIYIFGTVIIVNYIDKKVYSSIYISIMTIISVISLLYYSISLNSPDIVNRVAHHVQVGKTVFIVSPLYTWGFDSYIYPRNAGPFWEPGAFQGFISVALIMLLYYKNKIGFYKWKFIILTGTLITTQSTTGYIILGLIFIFFWRDILKFFSSKKGGLNSIQSLLLVPIIIGIVYGIYFIANSYTINNKFTDNNISYNARSDDVNNSLTLIFEKPFFGYGPEKSLRESSIGIEDNSVGLFSLIYTYGLVFFVMYAYRLKRGIDSMFSFNSRIKRICIYTIFVIMNMTQGFYYLPAFTVFLYRWPTLLKKSDTKEI